jgi:hypothetical protein
MVRRLAAEHERNEANHAERLWSLLCLEIWQRIFLDGEAPGDMLPAREMGALAGLAG